MWPAVKRELTDKLAQGGPPSGVNADGHELACVGRVAFEDRVELHVGAPQAIGKLHQGALAFDPEDDGKGARWEIAWARLACGVNKLCRRYTCWEIDPDDHVVGEGICNRPGANASWTWFDI